MPKISKRTQQIIDSLSDGWVVGRDDEGKLNVMFDFGDGYEAEISRFGRVNQHVPLCDVTLFKDRCECVRRLSGVNAYDAEHNAKWLHRKYAVGGVTVES